MDGEEILTTFYDEVPFEKRTAAGAEGWATPYKPSAGAA
jgi:DNA-directed RNA polymerase subunit beta